MRWTTKRQKMTLDKKGYRKGDTIKGKIDFECLDELIDPKYPNRPPRTIQVYGVFKAMVEKTGLIPIMELFSEGADCTPCRERCDRHKAVDAVRTAGA